MDLKQILKDFYSEMNHLTLPNTPEDVLEKYVRLIKRQRFNKQLMIWGIIELLTGLSGAAIIWYKFGFLITLSLFLLVWSAYCHLAIEINKN